MFPFSTAYLERSWFRLSPTDLARNFSLGQIRSLGERLGVCDRNADPYTAVFSIARAAEALAATFDLDPSAAGGVCAPDRPALTTPVRHPRFNEPTDPDRRGARPEVLFLAGLRRDGRDRAVVVLRRPGGGNQDIVVGLDALASWARLRQTVHNTSNRTLDFVVPVGVDTPQAFIEASMPLHQTQAAENRSRVYKPEPALLRSTARPAEPPRGR